MNISDYPWQDMTCPTLPTQSLCPTFTLLGSKRFWQDGFNLNHYVLFTSIQVQFYE